MEFLHKDEYKAKYPNFKVDYPVVLKQEEEYISVLLSQRKPNAITSVEELIDIVKASL
jgi:hypothetical protein